MTRDIKNGRFGWYEKEAMKKIESLPFKEQASCKLIYIALCSMSAKNQNKTVIECYRFDLARFASVSERTVYNKLPLLEEIGIIETEPQARGADGKYKKVRITLKQNNLAVCNLEESCGKDVGKFGALNVNTINKINKGNKQRNILPKGNKKSDDSSSQEEYGKREINELLEGLKKVVNCNEFRESQAWQRRWASHIVSLRSKIGNSEFKSRLVTILSDDFKKKNCNSLEYVYRELKSFIL